MPRPPAIRTLLCFLLAAPACRTKAAPPAVAVIVPDAGAIDDAVVDAVFRYVEAQQPPEVHAVVAEPGGGLLVAGRFRGERDRVETILRIGADGHVVPGFRAGFHSHSERLRDLLRLDDGSLIAGGDLVGRRLLKLRPDGRIDPAFDAGLPDGGEATIALLDDGGRLIVASGFTSAGRRGLVRRLADGRVDPTFVYGPEQDQLGVTCVIRAADGGLIIAEQRRGAEARVVRLGASGALDPSFQPAAFTGELVARVAALAEQPDGKILVAGNFEAPRPALARLRSDGTLDPSFTGHFAQKIEGSGPQALVVSGGKSPSIWVAGNFWEYGGVELAGIARLRMDGARDERLALKKGFNPGGVAALLPLPDGGVAVAGDFTDCDDQPRWGVAWLTADGALRP